MVAMDSRAPPQKGFSLRVKPRQLLQPTQATMGVLGLLTRTTTSLAAAAVRLPVLLLVCTIICSYKCHIRLLCSPSACSNSTCLFWGAASAQTLTPLWPSP